MQTPDWLTRAIDDGISRLLLLSLDRTPAHDAIDGVVLMWVDALRADRVWDEVRDTRRIREGFRRLARDSARWPTPSALLAALPPVPMQRALPRPKPNPEVARSALAEVGALLGVPPEGETYQRLRPLPAATRELMAQLDQQQSQREAQGESDHETTAGL